MRTNILSRIIFFSQIGFFGLLVTSGILLSVINSSSTKESNVFATITKMQKPIPIQQAPWYGSVSTGVYITNPTPKNEEALLGQKVSVLSWFVHWDEKMDNEKLAHACSNGYVPQITWESRKADELTASTYTLDDIIAGTYDAFITEELASIKSICKNQPVIIRFDHEMDTIINRVGWYPWQGNPEKYVAAWKHVVAISHNTSSTIKWLWSPNRGVEVTKQYYPGDEWVDYVGITLNRNEKQAHYTDFGMFYADNQKVIESFGKPVIISETTYDLDGGTVDGKTAWIESMTAYVASNPKIVSVSWFTSRQGQSFTSNPESIKALKLSYKTLDPK